MPWEDLRYMFGEIIYGGHIVEDWDRRLAAAYLSKLINESLLETPELFPNFVAPPSTYSIPQVCICTVQCFILFDNRMQFARKLETHVSYMFAFTC